MSYKGWFFTAVCLFVLGLILGLTIPISAAGPLSQEIGAFEELAKFLATLPQSSILAIIFIKNVSAVLLSFALSPVLCLMPVIALITNGCLLGQVSNMVMEEKSLGYLLAGILPHGVFEIPALIIGEAAAINFGVTVMLTPFKKERGNRLASSLSQNLKYLAVALALFLVAAVIETYITPLFLR